MARERKDRQVMVHLEEGLHTLLQVVTNDEDLPASVYFRSLLIRDLQQRKMLNEDILVSLLTGA